MPMAIPDSAGRVVLALALAPFAYFAARDFRLHLRARRVPLAENLIHLALGLVLAGALVRAFQFRAAEAAYALAIFAVCGAADEYVFHRGIPAEEHDVHAKEHYALFVFVAVFFALVQLRAGR
jgi:hypothetical protein